MKKNTLKDIRAIIKQLRSRAVMPNRKGNYIGYSLPELRDGIVYFGCVAIMHPSTFLDIFGVKRFRALKRDVSEKRIEAYIKRWRHK